jgi:NodT family efflux transporter outer membrane factor (OMF) lipoprotein
MIRPQQRALFIATLFAMSLGGCTVGPKYVQPDLATPASLVSVNAPTASTPLSRIDETPADLAAWWRGFKDPELDALVGRALSDNLDRQTAASRVREADAAALAVRAGLLPSLSGTAAYDHTRISSNAGLSQISSLVGGGVSTGGVATAALPGLEFDSYTLGLSASWSPDLFGGTQSALRAARSRQAAQVWSARDTEVAIVSQVAQAYVNLRADQARLAVLKAYTKQQSDLLDLIEARSRGGLVNEVETVEQRAQLESTQAQVAPLEADVALRIHQLSLLLGQAPDALAGELIAKSDPIAALPPAIPLIPVGLPSDLLRRRPDIRQAERILAASVADVDQATAALYPQLQLTGSYDLISTALKTLLDAASRDYVLGAALAQPLFDGGKLRAQKHETEEEAVQAAIAYRKAALVAFQKTADALAVYAADQRRLVALRAAHADEERSTNLNRAQYLGGIANLQGTLRAEAVALQDQDQLIQTQAQLCSDLVSLYRELGGGWAGSEDRSDHTPSLKTE